MLLMLRILLEIRDYGKLFQVDDDDDVRVGMRKTWNASWPWTGIHRIPKMTRTYSIKHPEHTHTEKILEHTDSNQCIKTQQCMEY